MAALGSQSIASSYEQLLHVDRDGGGNTTTHVSIKDGDNGTTFGFTIASDALMMTSTNRLEFGDTGTYIHQSADGVLDLVSDTEIELTATTIDLNGAVAMDGAITGGTNITISGELDAATLDISGDADIDGTLEADAITVNGTALATFIRDTVGTNMLSSNSESGITVTYDTTNDNIDFAVDAAQTGITSLLAADIKIGEDDETKIDFETANEIHLYANNTEQVYVADNIFGPNADSDVDLGATGVRWKDAFVDSITVTGEIDGASLDIEGNADINGTTNLDAVDIDGAVQIDNTVTVGADDQGYDVIFYGDTASSNMTWDTSADDLILNDSGLYIDQDDDATGLTVDHSSLSTGRGTFFFCDNDIGDGGRLVEIQADGDSGHANSVALQVRADAGNVMKAFNVSTLLYQMTSDGEITAPKNPAFMATMSGNQDNFAVGSDVTIVFGGTDRFDQGSNFSSNTFTAPVTGKYMINYNIIITAADSAASYYSLKIVTSNITYEPTIIDPDYGQDNDYISLSGSQLVDMDTSDTVHLAIRQGSGTAQTDISAASRFSGFLAC